MLETLLVQITQLIETSKSQKDALNKVCLPHIGKWSPILLHDILHHCLNAEQIPTKYEGESDFEFESRCISTRRRLINENRLAGCLLDLLQDKEANDNTTEIK